MKKKILSLSLVLMILISLIPNHTYAEDQDITLIINGQEIQSDVPLFIENGRTMIPVRLISENLGFEVGFSQNKDASIVSIANMQRMKGNPNLFDDNRLNLLLMTIGSNNIEVKNAKHAVEKTIQSEVAPKIVNGRTFVPIRILAENMAIQIEWDEITRSVIVTDQYKHYIVPKQEWF